REILERRGDHADGFPPAGQTGEEIGQNRGAGHAREARGERVARRRDAEQRHHLRALLAVALVGRIPDALVVLQRRYERADVVPRDAARTVDRAIALEGVRDYLVLRWSVQEAGRRQGDEGARGHLHGGEMRSEHYGASSAC